MTSAVINPKLQGRIPLASGIDDVVISKINLLLYPSSDVNNILQKRKNLKAQRILGDGM